MIYCVNNDLEWLKIGNHFVDPIMVNHGYTIGKLHTILGILSYIMDYL